MAFHKARARGEQGRTMGNRDKRGREQKKPKKKDAKGAQIEKRTGEESGLLKEHHTRISTPEGPPET